MEKVFHEFEPWFDSNCQILLLGTMPSRTSRKEGYYYAHPQNRFWKVLESVYKEKIIDKKAFCLKHHIALWDTCASCKINASSDATIQEIEPNPLEVILEVADIKQIYTIGKKAHQIYKKYLYPKYKREDICLPSTSSANASMSLEQLIKAFSILLFYQ